MPYQAGLAYGETEIMRQWVFIIHLTYISISLLIFYIFN